MKIDSQANDWFSQTKHLKELI